MFVWVEFASNRRGFFKEVVLKLWARDQRVGLSDCSVTDTERKHDFQTNGHGLESGTVVEAKD